MDEVSINDCVRPHYRMMIQEIVITRAYGNRFVLGNNKLLATQSRKVAVFMLTISAIEIKNLLFKVFFFLANIACPKVHSSFNHLLSISLT